MIIIAISGRICSGKNTYSAQYPEQFKKIDIGDIVRRITATQSRTHNSSLDGAIIDELQKELSTGTHSNYIIMGIRQVSIMKWLKEISEYSGSEFTSILLHAPMQVLEARYNKRVAEKDLKLSFKDAIKRDDLLGYSELEEYLYNINTNIIQNYSQNEIDSLQEK